MARRLFAFGPFTLDTERGTLLRDGRPIDIGHRALGVLHALLEANGQVMTKAELIDFAWPGAVVGCLPDGAVRSDDRSTAFPQRRVRGERG